MRQLAIYKGLRTLVTESRTHPDIMLQKLEAMQDAYLQANRDLYANEVTQSIRYYMKAVSYKFELASLSLEQLWSISEHTRFGVIDAIENSIDSLDVSEDELLMIAYSFESFLFYAQSFVEFYMLYICLVLKTGHQGSMSKKKFYRRLKNDLNHDLQAKALRVKQYFDGEVYGEADQKSISPENWGSLLLSLRDKVTHRDRLRPSFASDERLIDGVLLNWPTIQDETYDRFCQLFQNGMFYLISDCSEILYDLKWKSGSLKPCMWD